MEEDKLYYMLMFRRTQIVVNLNLIIFLFFFLFRIQSVSVFLIKIAS